MDEKTLEAKKKYDSFKRALAEQVKKKSEEAKKSKNIETQENEQDVKA